MISELDREWQEFFLGLYRRTGGAYAPPNTALVEKTGSITQIEIRSHGDLQDLDADDHPQYLKSIDEALVYAGSGIFGGSGGVTVQIGYTLAGTTYYVVIQPTTDAPIRVGEIAVISKTVSSFVVTNSGSDVATTFDWILVDKSV